MSHYTYVLTVTYVGFYSNSKDTKFEKVVKKEMDGSGYGFGGRDISFWFRTKREMKRAQRRIYRAKSKGIKLPRYMTEIHSF